MLCDVEQGCRGRRALRLAVVAVGVGRIARVRRDAGLARQAARRHGNLGVHAAVQADRAGVVLDVVLDVVLARAVQWRRQPAMGGTRLFGGCGVLLQPCHI